MDTFEELDDLLEVFGLGYNRRSTTNDETTDNADRVSEPCELETDHLVEEFLSSLAAAAGNEGNTSGEEDEQESNLVNPQSLTTSQGNATVANFTPLAIQSLLTPRRAADDTDDPQRDLNDITERVSQGCGCHLKCLNNITVERVLDNVLKMREMLKETREAHILSRIIPVEGNERCRDNTRRRKRCNLYFGNTRVCQMAFQLIFDVKRGTLQRMQNHVCENGIEPRVHRLTGRRPSNAFSHVVIKDAVQYLLNYASEEGLPQPAPLRGRTGLVPIYLPICKTKHGIHGEYVQCCRDQEKTFVGLSTFKDIWKRCIPHIKIMGPKDDVCKQCEDFIEQISLARTEEDKLTSTAQYHAHVLAARSEREEYKRCVTESTALFELQTGEFNKIHCTFDFSQYLKLPHHAREKGPTFFIQPRKVQLFGFRVDGYKQYNYLIDEDQTIGKNGELVHGPDSVISMVDHAFTEFHLPGDECRIHADNCFAQNKIRYVMAYFSWRTMTGRHRRITYMMQLPGHTRCLIDAGFGRIKQKYRLEDTDTVQHLASVVDRSSTSNVPVLYGNWQWRAWKEFLSLRFKKVPNINSYYYFRFESCDPGAVYMRKSAIDTDETRFVVCKTPLLPMAADDIPRVLPAAGLSEDRKRYLFKHVRPLVRVLYRDILCPFPDSN